MGINIPSRGDSNHVVAHPDAHRAPARAHGLCHRPVAPPRHHPARVSSLDDREVRPLGGWPGFCLAEPDPELVDRNGGPMVDHEQQACFQRTGSAGHHRRHRCDHRLSHGEARAFADVRLDLPGVQGCADGNDSRTRDQGDVPAGFILQGRGSRRGGHLDSPSSPVSPRALGERGGNPSDRRVRRCDEQDGTRRDRPRNRQLGSHVSSVLVRAVQMWTGCSLNKVENTRAPPRCYIGTGLFLS